MKGAGEQTTDLLLGDGGISRGLVGVVGSGELGESSSLGFGDVFELLDVDGGALQLGLDATKLGPAYEGRSVMPSGLFSKSRLT